MDQFGWNVKCLARAHPALDQRLILLEPQDDFPRQHVDRFVFLVVILQREHVARLDVQDLADVAVRLCPDDLVAPGLVDPVRDVVHASLSLRDDGRVTHAVTHTPHPTHPSGFSTGCPRVSSASAFSPTGQARAHTPHSAPWKVMQRSGSSSSTPIRTVSHGTLVSAPVSHAAAQGMSSHTMQACD